MLLTWMSREATIDEGAEKEERQGTWQGNICKFCEVLHRVLYPNTHKNGDQKKKKKHQAQDLSITITKMLMGLLMVKYQVMFFL
jgi:hypothetical protein